MRRNIALHLMLALLGGCGSDDEAPGGVDAGGLEDPGDVSGDGDGDGDGDTGEVPCVDQSIMVLDLLDNPAAGEITTSMEDDAHVDTIDATAGGLMITDSYVYARFTDDGLEKVELNDEDAFESNAWHIAFRRYVIRLNSGVAGPGEVMGARTPPATEFDALDAVPENLSFNEEAYFTESCDFVVDNSGLPNAASTVLSNYWRYESCLIMTGNVYVIQLGADDYVKLQVLAYYSPENQAICDETGSVPQPSGGGNLMTRWAPLSP